MPQKPATPSRIYRRRLLELGVAEATLAEVEAGVEAELIAAEEEALSSGDPLPTATAKKSLPVELTHPAHERRGVDGEGG